MVTWWNTHVKMAPYSYVFCMSKWKLLLHVFLLNEAPRLPRSIIAQLQLWRVPVSSITHKPTPQRRESRRAGISCIYTRLREMNCRRWSWPLYWAMSAGSRSFSTEHFRPLALLGEEEIRGEASHIPLPSLSSSHCHWCRSKLQKKRVESLKSFSAMSLKEPIDFIRMESRKSFGCLLIFTIDCYYYSVCLSVCSNVSPLELFI